MEKKTLAAITAVGLAAAISIPTVVFGNARRNSGSFRESHLAAIPYVAQLSGANEVPAAALPPAPALVGVGNVAVSFDVFDPADILPGGAEAEACFDITYSNILTPVAAHIHRGAAGQAPANNIVVPLFTAPGPNVGATSATGCVPTTAALATEISATPASFYVNVHTALFPGGAMRGQLEAGPAPAGSAHLLAVPLRAYDSRDAAGPKILPGQTRTISLATGKTLAGVSGIAVPPGSGAAIVTLTVTETTVGVGGNGGFLKLYSAASPEPATSSINWAGVDQNVAVSTQVAVDASGQVKVTAGANATHFVIDVIGYQY